MEWSTSHDQDDNYNVLEILTMEWSTNQDQDDSYNVVEPPPGTIGRSKDVVWTWVKDLQPFVSLDHTVLCIFDFVHSLRDGDNARMCRLIFVKLLKTAPQ
ncbi:hypothetical protein ACFE04_026873 [Oxalis oulophora]